MAGTAFSTSSWGGYDEATLTNPASAQTDFPLLIDIANLSASWKAAVQSDGGDIRLTTDSDTEIPFDVIDWAYNSGAPTGKIRVKRTVAASGTQKVRIWCGHGSAVAYDANETYGSDNAYKSTIQAYWPQGGGADRTSNGYDLTAGGGVSVGGASGQIGKATTFDGSDDICSIASAGVSATPITMSCWFNTPNTTGFHRLFQIDDGDSSTNRDMWVFECDTNKIRGFSARSSTFGIANSAATFSASAWNFGAARFDSNTTRYTYLNGTLLVGTTSTDVAVAGVDNMRIGALFYDGTIYYTAQTIQEVMLFSETLSEDWLDYEYLQSSNNSSFWGTWTWTATTGTYTASADLSVGGATAIASASHTTPTYVAGAAVTSGGASAESSATATGNTYSASGAVTSGGTTASVAATHAIPTYAAAVGVSIGGTTTGIAAAFTAPTYAADAAPTLSGATVNASAAATNPTYDADVTITAGAAAVEVAALFATVVYQASVAAIIGGTQGDSLATYTPPTRAASVSVTASGAQSVASATHMAPIYIGSGVVTVGGASAALVAVYSIAVSHADCTVACGAVTVSAAGTFEEAVSQYVGQTYSDDFRADYWELDARADYWETNQ